MENFERNLYLAPSTIIMENVQENYLENKPVDNANNPANYWMMTIGIFVIMVGMLLRFFGEWSGIDIVSNLIALVGICVALKAVSNILK